MDRIARHAKDLLNADSSAIFLPDAGSANYRAIVAVGEMADAIKDTVIERGVGIIGSLVAKRPRRIHQRYAGRPARRADRRARNRTTTSG